MPIASATGVPLREGAVVLALDAATYGGSVALLRGTEVLAERSTAMRGEREERLMPAVADALAAWSIGVADVDAVVCGAGPGSFTSLRIAASIAKGVAQGVGVPLFAVSSLALIVAGAADALGAGRYLSAIDALRGEAYVALYEIGEGGTIGELAPARLVGQRALGGLADEKRARLVGPNWPVGGALEGLAPRAAGAAVLLAWAPRLWVAADLASWEPSYGRLAEAQVKWEAAHGRALARGDLGAGAPNEG